MRQSFDHCQCFAITHLQHQVCVRLTLVWSVLWANLSHLLLYIVLDAVLICYWQFQWCMLSGHCV